MVVPRSHLPEVPSWRWQNPMTRTEASRRTRHRILEVHRCHRKTVRSTGLDGRHSFRGSFVVLCDNSCVYWLVLDQTQSVPLVSLSWDLVLNPLWLMHVATLLPFIGDGTCADGEGLWAPLEKTDVEMAYPIRHLILKPSIWWLWCNRQSSDFMSPENCSDMHRSLTTRWQARQQAELRTDMPAGDLCFPEGVPQLNTRSSLITWLKLFLWLVGCRKDEVCCSSCGYYAFHNAHRLSISQAILYTKPNSGCIFFLPLPSFRDVAGGSLALPPGGCWGKSHCCVWTRNRI